MDTDPAEAWEITGWKLEQAEPIRREIKSYVFLNSGASEGFRGTVKYAGKTESGTCMSGTAIWFWMKRAGSAPT